MSIRQRGRNFFYLYSLTKYRQIQFLVFFLRNLIRNLSGIITRAELPVQEEVKRARAARTKVYWNLTCSCSSLINKNLEMRRGVNGLPFVIQFRKTSRAPSCLMDKLFLNFTKRNPGCFETRARPNLSKGLIKQITKCLFCPKFAVEQHQNAWRSLTGVAQMTSNRL